MVKVLFASAVPVIVGFVLLMVAVVVVITGALGAVVSTVKMTALVATDLLPAASVAVAVIVWAACVRAVVGV